MFLLPKWGREGHDDKLSDDDDDAEIEDPDDDETKNQNAQNSAWDVNDPFALAELAEHSIPKSNAQAKDPDSEDPFKNVSLFRVNF